MTAWRHVAYRLLATRQSHHTLSSNHNGSLYVSLERRKNVRTEGGGEEERNSVKHKQWRRKKELKKELKDRREKNPASHSHTTLSQSVVTGTCTLPVERGNHEEKRRRELNMSCSNTFDVSFASLFSPFFSSSTEREQRDVEEEDEEACKTCCSLATSWTINDTSSSSSHHEKRREWKLFFFSLTTSNFFFYSSNSHSFTRSGCLLILSLILSAHFPPHNFVGAKVMQRIALFSLSLRFLNLSSRYAANVSFFRIILYGIVCEKREKGKLTREEDPRISSPLATQSLCSRIGDKSDGRWEEEEGVIVLPCLHMTTVWSCGRFLHLRRKVRCSEYERR